jgi:hypothetical protein
MTVIHEGNYARNLGMVTWQRRDGSHGSGQLYPLEFAIWFGRIWAREQPDCVVTVVAGRGSTLPAKGANYGQAA